MNAQLSELSSVYFKVHYVCSQWSMGYGKNTFEEVCDAIDLKFKEIWKIIAPQE